MCVRHAERDVPPGKSRTARRLSWSPTRSETAVLLRITLLRLQTRLEEECAKSMRRGACAGERGGLKRGVDVRGAHQGRWEGLRRRCRPLPRRKVPLRRPYLHHVVQRHLERDAGQPAAPRRPGRRLLAAGSLALRQRRETWGVRVFVEKNLSLLLSWRSWPGVTARLAGSVGALPPAVDGSITDLFATEVHG